ncbi:MAG: saccharopine dehydrogenase NADP-binding domain-containing protein [Rhodospirillaceae bacterium]|nr:saccharopine dehydrogenase NADP-binding domain-containing protein [Rhodospirillaceae bacterium]
MKHTQFSGRLVILGFGSIGQGSLPLILRHIDMDPSLITIITAENRGKDIADELGIKFTVTPITKENYKTVLSPMLGKGDFLLNLSVDVSSVALVELCRELGALYLDTCIEPWAGGYTSADATPSERSNYAMRETMLALRTNGPAPTALVTHGANPGLVSHFVKKAMLNIARDTGLEVTPPKTRAEWAQLGENLSIKVIHIAERDTQVAGNTPKQVDEFVNTWSIDGFISEGCQPGELGWGTHEKHFPADGGRHDFASGAAIYLNRPGASVRVRSWTPTEGPFHGFLITHSEAISIADYFTLNDGSLRYRPTVHYSYHPCDDAVLSVHEFVGKNYNQQSRQRLMLDEITSGVDELGVLLMGHKNGAYWYGSQLSIDEARKLVPYNNATGLQVSVSVLAGMVWAIENPSSGVVEPDEIDYHRILEICEPYLGPVIGAYSDWTPLQDRETLFPEDVDRDDPWQFKNFRVI